ncbi:hypothetical protein GUJ93_ZPchr0007g5396 [Zizania palustris]|uniref:Uncharacterized protein n=1 Tax=Zizania palustris TaxID=103762 RepID=A0A8J5TKE6_ZIZPA|nr:hypothetical protein GUJ93_ZPchr0007g5396 [Zizania palustris]
MSYAPRCFCAAPRTLHHLSCLEQRTHNAEYGAQCGRACTVLRLSSGNEERRLDVEACSSPLRDLTGEGPLHAAVTANDQPLHRSCWAAGVHPHQPAPFHAGPPAPLGTRSSTAVGRGQPSVDYFIIFRISP